MNKNATALLRRTRARLPPINVSPATSFFVGEPWSRLTTSGIKLQLMLTASLLLRQRAIHEQKWACKSSLDWKGVTPSAQTCDVYNDDSKSILRAARMLECKESVECHCTETHVGGHFWLAVTHTWLSCERQVTHENEIPKRSRPSIGDKTYWENS